MSVKRKKSSFEKWHSLEIHKIFGICEQARTELLLSWINVPPIIPENYIAFIEKLRVSLAVKERDWNEAELIMKFIGPLLLTINFDCENFNSYANRPIKALTSEYELSGIVDWFVATGLHEPEKPYFIIHEYKKFQATQADPLGQLLIAMYASQLNNRDTRPVYGCYIVGRQWYFILLEGNKYSSSRGYDACDSDELAQIWAILNHTKTLIEGYITQSSKT